MHHYRDCSRPASAVPPWQPEPHPPAPAPAQYTSLVAPGPDWLAERLCDRRIVRLTGRLDHARAARHLRRRPGAAVAARRRGRPAAVAGTAATPRGRLPEPRGRDRREHARTPDPDRRAGP
ncbi:ATP-dependent Clp protease proteolytic subunit [Rhodococcus aetherivorans]|uniref:ATP-dependent Clp protease proteolytic subunit n=1 Tax=Rhodococcus aetherivorans TaxID=191292 RepID=A0ABQ0YIH2_9NOCA|nr:ATP-dependent Clp protease proteolytic subunit [Rhodococcus aetherivorans]